ncbi:MAG: hypothetical protein R3C14_54295 [Caldilineaceae bacterium]
MRDIDKRLARLEQSKAPAVPWVVRWSKPEPGQMDLRTLQPVAMAQIVRVAVVLGDKSLVTALLP